MKQISTLTRSIVDDRFAFFQLNSVRLCYLTVDQELDVKFAILFDLKSFTSILLN